MVEKPRTSDREQQCFSLHRYLIAVELTGIYDLLIARDSYIHSGVAPIIHILGVTLDLPYISSCNMQSYTGPVDALDLVFYRFPSVASHFIHGVFFRSH